MMVVMVNGLVILEGGGTEQVFSSSYKTVTHGIKIWLRILIGDSSAKCGSKPSFDYLANSRNAVDRPLY